MTFKLNKDLALSDQDIKREKRIISRLNITKLPFQITEKNFCSRYIDP